MFKRTCLALAALATTLAVGTAHAGYVNTQVVTIDPIGRQAYGSLYATRNSPDSNAYIGCAVQVDAGSPLAFCEAHGTSASPKDRVSCQTTDPEMIQTARSLGAYDVLTFLWDEKGQCTYINVNHTSGSAPSGR